MVSPRRDTLGKQVADEIRRRIVSGEITAGQRLKERELAASLGVSRGPIREAVRLLERDGLVQLRPYSGAQVVRIQRSEIGEILTLRRQVESFAFANAAVAGDTVLIEHLMELAALMREAHQAQDVSRLVDLDSEFHLAVCEGSTHPILPAMLRALLPRLMILLYPNAFRHHTAQSFADSHFRLIDALKTRDLATAVQGIDHHIVSNSPVGVEVGFMPVPVPVHQYEIMDLTAQADGLTGQHWQAAVPARGVMNR